MIANLRAECASDDCEWARSVRYPVTDIDIVHSALSYIVREPTHLVQIFVNENPEDLATVLRDEDLISARIEDETAA